MEKKVSNKCAGLFNRIDELEKDFIDFWIDVCKIESPTDYKEGVDRVGRYCIEYAEKRGWDIEVQKQPISGDCICITMNTGAQGKPVIFSGHMDTVHAVGSFGEKVVHCDEEKIYGPGVIDCKGGIVAAFYAMAALEDCGFKSRPVKLLLQSEEENSSKNSNKSTIQFMGQKATGCIAFLNAEGCVGSGRKIAITRKGILRYEFQITGVSVHAGKCYEGASAIREAACKILELEKLQDPDGITCNCGLINGGTVANSVPDKCSFIVDVRFRNEQERKKAEQLVKEIADKTFVAGTVCQLTMLSWRYAMERNDANLELFQQVNQILEDNGLEKMVAIESAGGSDAADMTMFGIPCIDNMGPKGDFCHSPKEFGYLASLAETAKRLAAVAWCI